MGTSKNNGRSNDSRKGWFLPFQLVICWSSIYVFRVKFQATNVNFSQFFRFPQRSSALFSATSRKNYLFLGVQICHRLCSPYFEPCFEIFGSNYSQLRFFVAKLGPDIRRNFNVLILLLIFILPEDNRPTLIDVLRSLVSTNKTIKNFCCMYSNILTIVNNTLTTALHSAYHQVSRADRFYSKIRVFISPSVVAMKNY